MQNADRSIKGTGRKTKIIFNTESPFSSVTWPEISHKDQESILDLLCSLLAPIGQHRSDHATKSKGKRTKKRKRAEVKADLETAKKNETPIVPPAELPPPPPPPDLCFHLTVGLNSTTRHLELLAQNSIPQSFLHHLQLDVAAPIGESKKRGGGKEEAKNRESRALAAVFLPRFSQPSSLYAHLPLLAATASLSSSLSVPIRLVSLPKNAEKRLTAALGLPRVGFVGVMEDAPHAGPLLEYVRAHVPVVKVPWLQEASSAEYLPVKIKALKTSAPVTTKDSNTVKGSKDPFTNEASGYRKVISKPPTSSGDIPS